MRCSVWGIHGRNGDDNLVGEILEVNPSHVTILHLQSWAGKEIVEQIDGILHVRFYLTRWSQWDPEVWAQECAFHAMRDRGGWCLLQFPRIHFSPSNEMNLEVEGGGEDVGWYDVIDDWLYRWVVRFRQVTGCLRERLHWPALAYGHNELEYGYARCARSLAEFGVLGCHSYWYTPEQLVSQWYGRRYLLDHQATGKLVFVSEAGNFRVTDPGMPDEMVVWFESLYLFPFVIGATPFIRSSPDPGHRDNDWSRNRELIRAVREAPRTTREVVVMVDETQTLEEQYPDLYQAWKDQEEGGHADAFRAHLVAIGALPVDREAVEFLRARLDGSLNELVLAVERAVQPPFPQP